MDIEIIEAIKNKNLIEIYYANELQIVEPHCYGISETGADYLIAFQVESCQTPENQGWKFFDLAKAVDLNVLVKTFEKTRDDYNKQKIAVVLACL